MSIDINIKNHLSDETEREDEILFSLNSLTKQFNVDRICENGYIAFEKTNNNLWLNFYVFSFFSGTEDDINVKLIWNGSGALDNLREIRHSYFCEYVFCIDLKLIEQASKWLQRHFD